jgi:hypothetical protein
MKEKTPAQIELENALIRIISMRAKGMIDSIQVCLHAIGSTIPKNRIDILMPFIEQIRIETDLLKEMAEEQCRKRFTD